MEHALHTPTSFNTSLERFTQLHAQGCQTEALISYEKQKVELYSKVRPRSTPAP